MDIDFWHRRWEKNEIGWHENSGNAQLIANFRALLPELETRLRIFVPLSGKSVDIGWLLDRGCKIVAVELNETAVIQLFESLGLEPEVKRINSHLCYRAKDIEVFVGDFFSLSSIGIGKVDAIFDRASLMALPEGMRVRYAHHLTHITDSARQLLIVFEYDQEEMVGPPFSISFEEVSRHYKQHYTISLLSSADVSGQLRGEFAAIENAYLLEPRGE